MLPPLEEWYSPDKTSTEMGKILGKTASYVTAYLKRMNLPWKRQMPVFEYHDPVKEGWYDPAKTIAEMAAISGLSSIKVRNILIRRKLTYKSVQKCQPLPDWYDKDKTAEEMAKESGLKLKAVRSVLNKRKLEYKKKTTHKQSGQRSSYEEFLKFYHKNLTVLEMSLISGIEKMSIYRYLNEHKLPYLKLVERLTIGPWYSPEKTVGEMSYESGLSVRSIQDALHYRGLPYKMRCQERFAIREDKISKEEPAA